MWGLLHYASHRTVYADPHPALWSICQNASDSWADSRGKSRSLHKALSEAIRPSKQDGGQAFVIAGRFHSPMLFCRRTRSHWQQSGLRLSEQFSAKDKRLSAGLLSLGLAGAVGVTQGVRSPNVVASNTRRRKIRFADLWFRPPRDRASLLDGRPCMRSPPTRPQRTSTSNPAPMSGAPSCASWFNVARRPADAKSEMTKLQQSRDNGKEAIVKRGI
jgi:hypothetical protein